MNFEKKLGTFALDGVRTNCVLTSPFVCNKPIQPESTPVHLHESKRADKNPRVLFLAWGLIFPTKTTMSIFQRRHKQSVTASTAAEIADPDGKGKLRLMASKGLTGFSWIMIIVPVCIVSIMLIVRASGILSNGLPEAQLVFATETQTYISAMATMRCFVTPGCFPGAACRKGHPKKVRRKKKWEEQSFCVHDLNISREELGSMKSCLVYSFGIHESYDWEAQVARIFGCEVHAFDPTMNHDTDLAPGVTFHRLGLQGVGTNMSQTHADEYDAIDPDLLLSLDQVMTRLGHGRRPLDLLMLDCEGCEWGVLRNLACSKRSSTTVKQIVGEFHFQSSLGLRTEADVLIAADAVRCLWEERWHITSIEGAGAGRANWVYAPGVSSILHSVGMLLYIALEKIPSDEQTPAEIIEEMATLGLQMGDHAFKEGKTLLLEKHRTLRTKLGLVARPRVKFDVWERMTEQ